MTFSLARLSLRVMTIALGIASHVLSAAGTAPRERLLMDFGWKFHLGDDWGIAHNLAKAGTGFGPAGTSFSDVSWRTIDLPHDWAIELPFDRKADASHGFRALGQAFPENSVGWYRRKFELPASDASRRIWLEFDGVFRDSTVFVNGWFVGRHESGYHPMRYDITDVVECGGNNVVAVRVDATHTEGWFYEGAGIYRHVWLVKTDTVAIAPDGVFVYSSFKDNVPVGPATIHLETTLTNSLKAPADAKVSWRILAPDGATVATANAPVMFAAAGEAKFQETATVSAPQLWSPETPRLYKLITEVESGGKVIDTEETVFGIRTVAFDVEKGFILNGSPYVIKGTCNHQDHAGVGAALPDSLQYFRIATLKTMGSNAYRSAHNPPTKELLDACDRLGMLVMTENRLVGSDAERLKMLEELVRRDRNRASVVIWSLGNEEFTVQGTPSGARVAATMQDLVKRLDPTRPVTCNAAVGNEYAGINSVIEVRGWSYRVGAETMDAYHAEHPEQPNVGSEQGSTTTTRGIYTTDPKRGYMSAYDDNKESWSNLAKEWWGFFATRPWLSGGFIWTGFDYRGEPTPYSWPCISSHFGIFDTCGFPKDLFWYYKAWWNPEPVLHLMPHWTWTGREGQEIDVRALSNCDEIELFLNGRSLGRQPMPRNSEVKWMVPYEAGTLAARGYTGGVLVAEKIVETIAAPAAVQLAPDRAQIRADGEDVSVITVSIVDAKGRVVPVAGNNVSFELSGPGRIIGVGNGDPSCHEPDKYFSAPPVSTIAVGGWKWKHEENVYDTNLAALKPEFDDSTWQPADVDAESGPLKLRERAVFRTRFTVAPEILDAVGVELWFGKIDGDASVYLNGVRIGPGGGSRSASVFEVKSKLFPGENTIAIAVANYGEAAGVNKGVSLRLVGEPPPVSWSRSVFNGLAQIIVQSSKEPGTITLTARADGLEPAAFAITAEPVTLRPALP